MLRNAGSVGDPVKVDSVVAQDLANAVEVPDGDAGGVLRDVGLGTELVEAPARFVGDLACSGLELRDFSTGAVERIRFPGAALIDQDDVAIAMDPGKDR